MGYGDDRPPAIRADPKPARLDQSSGFQMLILTFVKWDVIKLKWSLGSGQGGGVEIGSDALDTDYFFQPVLSDGVYTFTAQGCNKAVDGSTNYCSPVSLPFTAVGAHNTNSLRQFLELSGVDLRTTVSLAALISNRTESLRAIMGLSEAAP